jgi:hypothetical protein
LSRYEEFTLLRPRSAFAIAAKRDKAVWYSLFSTESFPIGFQEIASETYHNRSLRDSGCSWPLKPLSASDLTALLVIYSNAILPDGDQRERLAG